MPLGPRSELFERGIIEPIQYEDIFRANGEVVLNGAFAVEKKGKAGVGQQRVTRLIMNNEHASAANAWGLEYIDQFL